MWVPVGSIPELNRTQSMAKFHLIRLSSIEIQFGWVRFTVREYVSGIDDKFWQRYWNMAKWVKWNIHVQYEVVFLRFSLLWGFSEDVLHLDNYMMTFCFFEFWYIYCVLYSIFFEIVVSEIIYFIHQIVVINNQISACALIDQSAMVYCAGKLMEKLRVFSIII